ncbi:hypothetical protein BDZ89DRAFT_1087415 [Hymenopellis radicata]|nr:hypothetical protein BDZ89DRAFT_1087415 [Hymenopellis radicata]
MARCSDLPQELIALIIDFHRTQSTLRQCSLVCRAWLPPSQRRLFHAFRKFKVNKVAVLPPVYYTPEPGIDLVADVQNLFSLLPNITKICVHSLASSPFLFTNRLLRQCPELRKFTINGAIDLTDHLVLRRLKMPSAIDSPLDLDAVVRSVERLTLDSSRTFSVWHPYFRSILPHWSELKISCDVDRIQTWGDVLRTSNLSHLRRLHVRVSIYISPAEGSSQFPHDDASPLFSSAPNLDHLLLITKVSYVLTLMEDISIEVVSSMVEWYLCTLTALSESGKSMLKELTLTVMALDDSTVAAAWAKVDDILSTNAFSKLEHTSSHPNTVRLLEQALPELSRRGKLAV